MIRKIVLEDDSFMEEEIVDDYEVLREFQNASSPRDYEFHAPEPNAADNLPLHGLTGIETFEAAEPWRNRIRPR